MKLSGPLILGWAVILSSLTARADDGGIAWGGNPKLLQSHPSVAMQSEVINITVRDETVTADCRFVFRNRGKATTVRMGFPAEGAGEYDADRSMDLPEGQWRKAKPISVFRSFRSWVDGRVVPTRVIHAERPGQVWHAKTVTFPANSTRVVRDVYTVPLGGQATGTGYYREASYTLHTGASWRGPIGRVEVNFHFPEQRRAITLRPLSLRSLKKQGAVEVDWRRLPVGAVVYAGPGTPLVRGRTLSFVSRQLEPTRKDDITVAFYYQGYNQSAG